MTARSIPFFPYPSLFASDEAALLDVIKDVCRRGAYILQKDCMEFEAALASYVGAEHALGVANGTDAIMIGLRAAGISAGDEVIIPSHTYIATAAAIRMVGATPVLAEIGADHMLDPADVERRITSRTRAVMPVQINGRTCDMTALADVADRHGLLLCEDAAQGLGSRFAGRAAGTFGVFGTISFYPAKLLGCFGDGGAILTNDPAIAEQIGLLRDHGRDREGRVVAWGLNSRLDNLQAAILNHKLTSFAAAVERRRQLAALYDDGLADMGELTLPPAPGSDPRHYDVYQNYEIECDRRDELQQHLERRGIRTIVQWAGTPVHQFRNLGFTVDLPITDRFFTRCLMLPMNVAVTDDDAAYIINSIRQFYGR